MRSQLTSLRPLIHGIVIENETGELERFQNGTLRPILKFQNDLIQSVFRFHIEKHKLDFHEMIDSKRKAYIEQVIYKDRKIYHLLKGIIIGHFTDKEWQTYIQHDKELNRRITNLLIQRLQDQS